jgi:hypothetical protein
MGRKCCPRKTAKVFYFWICSRRSSFEYISSFLSRFYLYQFGLLFYKLGSTVHCQSLYDASPACIHCSPGSAHQVRATNHHYRNHPELTNSQHCQRCGLLTLSNLNHLHYAQRLSSSKLHAANLYSNNHNYHPNLLL